MLGSQLLGGVVEVVVVLGRSCWVRVVGSQRVLVGWCWDFGGAKVFGGGVEEGKR